MTTQELQTVVLHGTRTTVVLEIVPGEAPLWRYWGPKLPEGALPPAPLRDGRTAAPFSLEFDQPLSLFPTFGIGTFGESALLAHRDGRDFAQAFTDTGVRWLEPEQAVAITLTDPVAQLTVEISLSLDPMSDVLTLSSRLTNDGPGVLDVQWLASGVTPLPGSAERVMFPSGRHANEFIACETGLGRAGWRRENRRGLTSHDAFPGAVATLPGATAHGGVAYGAQLAWSGNHLQSIQWLDDAGYQWMAGAWLAPGEVRLATGESLSSPELLATVSEEGWNGVAQNFHAAIRRRMSWPGGSMTPRPVHLNTWEGVYFDHDLAEMQALATTAAELGVERFVLDDGWFHRRTDDCRALGDWHPDADKYPDGLAPLASHVTALGMEFGLWVEPEMINEDSDLFRAHPDWALQIAGRPLLTGRNQLVLDMGRREVGDHLFDALSRLLSTLPIGYLKWDHNRDLTTAGGADGVARYRSQVLGTYALLDRIREAFPQVEIEACAGGGGRIDAGILNRTHRVWTSDCIDARSRVAIQRGFLQFMPPEIMGAHVGAFTAHSTGRSQALAFRAGVAAPGHFGLELNAKILAPAEKAELAQWIALHKAWRGRLHSGRVWLGDAGDSLPWQAHGEADALLLFLYRIEPSTLRRPPTLRLPMLDRGRVYRVLRVDPPDPHGHPMLSAPALDAMRADGLEVHGAWLAEVGLPIPPMQAETSAVFSVTAL